MFWKNKPQEMTPPPAEFNRAALVEDLKERLHIFINEGKELEGYRWTTADIAFLEQLEGDESLSDEEKNALSRLKTLVEKKEIGY